MTEAFKVNAAPCSCSPLGEQAGTCRVEAIIPIDERGQIVIPKGIREKLGLQGNDKLVLISWEKDGAIESLSIVKNDAFSDIVKNYYTNK